jgi:ribosomal protein S12 methylthiotransferase
VSQVIPLASLDRAAAPGPPRVALVALGCPKNLVDAEQMLGALTAAGYEVTTQAETAQVVIVNTCSFLAAARDEALREIAAAARLKRLGVCDTLVVSGCLAQLDPDLVRRRCPQVDIIVGVSEFPQIAALVASVRADRGARPVAVSPADLRYPDYLPRRRATPPQTAYLKIAEGCNCACTFCLIPTIRGAFRSRGLDSVVGEARRLAAEGVGEIILIAEDLTQYGHDWSGRRQLPALLRALGQIERLRWVRLLYCYPTKIDAELIAAMAETPNVVKYLDLPLQHADDEILRAMNRGGRREGYLRLLGELRAAMPEICLRSTFIVGFPGERRTHFETLERFLEEAQLDRVGFFPFSPEPGTPAAEMAGQVPSGVARSRVARLAERQAAISAGRNAAWVGRELEVLVESGDESGGLGRSFRDAPEIDGVVRLTGAVRGGQWRTARITAADTHDLSGDVSQGEQPS